MNADVRSLYQEVILDHNKNPRNFRSMPEANRTVEAYNPLCGDHYTLYVKVAGGIVEDVSFQGTGCAISKASASVMSSLVRGKSTEEVVSLFERFHRLVTGRQELSSGHAGLGKLEAFAGVSEFPARVKCAVLAWHALKGALDEKKEAISTE